MDLPFLIKQVKKQYGTNEITELKKLDSRRMSLNDEKEWISCMIAIYLLGNASNSWSRMEETMQTVFLTWVGLDWNSVEDRMARVFYCWAVVKVLPFPIKPALTPPQCREEHLVTTGWKRNCRQTIYFLLTLGERNALSLASGDKYFLSLPCFFYITISAQSLSRIWLFATPWTLACQAPLSLGFFPGKNTEWVAISYSRAGPPI